MCECGRMYKSTRDSTGKTMCPLCYADITEETLKTLWETPVQTLDIKLK